MGIPLVLPIDPRGVSLIPHPNSNYLIFKFAGYFFLQEYNILKLFAFLRSGIEYWKYKALVLGNTSLNQ